MMLKISKWLASSRKPFVQIINRQYFSVLFMDKGYYEPVSFDVLIQDIEDNDLYGEISRLLKSLTFLHSNMIKSNSRKLESVLFMDVERKDLYLFQLELMILSQFGFIILSIQDHHLVS